jgi:exopolysaccharide biosynthesis predicted pyruvyltransferase EpsI
MTEKRKLLADDIGDLKQKFVSALEIAIGDRTRVALLDFPFHRNCGDSLIYLGELAALKELGVDIVAVSEANSFRPKDYLSLPSDTVMLFHGGGNFGGLWDIPHVRRNEELTNLRTFKAILLPQTMTVMDEECQRRTRDVLADHSDVTLMWRDRESFERSSVMFPTARSVLVPDAAFSLHPMRPPKLTFRSRERIGVLARMDREGDGHLAEAVDRSVPVGDWECIAPEKVIRRLLKYAIELERSAPGRPRMKLRAMLFHAYAHLNGRSAARQLSSSQVMVVDRLHAWLLCVLLNVPHVVVETRYGKITGVITSWLPQELATVAASSTDAITRARSVAALVG